MKANIKQTPKLCVTTHPECGWLFEGSKTESDVQGNILAVLQGTQDKLFFFILFFKSS